MLTEFFINNSSLFYYFNFVQKFLTDFFFNIGIDNI